MENMDKIENHEIKSKKPLIISILIGIVLFCAVLFIGRKKDNDIIEEPEENDTISGQNDKLNKIKKKNKELKEKINGKSITGNNSKSSKPSDERNKSTKKEGTAIEGDNPIIESEPESKQDQPDGNSPTIN